MNQKTSLLVAFVLFAIGFFVYSQYNPQMAPAGVDNNIVSPPVPEEQLMATPAESKEVPLSSGTIDIEAGSFYFKPSVLKIKKGEKVTINLKSVDMMHDFVIDELNLKIPVTNSGSEAMVVFTPTEVGEYEYYCSVGNGFHKKQGQVGKLIVVE